MESAAESQFIFKLIEHILHLTIQFWLVNGMFSPMLFLKLIARLDADRIKDLCERLQLSLQFRENVYRLMQQILSLQ
ncbi:hypothetical protein AAC387_Pa12g0510 [Persea americana]